MIGGLSAEDRRLLRSLTDSVRGQLGDIVQAVLLFGSCASGQVSPRSDVDLLVVVEPPPSTAWSAAMNIEIRRRLTQSITDSSRPVDLWVRTVSQVDDAGKVYGGVEYWAVHGGVQLYWRRPRCPLQPPRSAVAIRVHHVASALDDAQRLLSGALREALSPGVDGDMRQHYLVRRSIERTLLAFFIAHAADVMRKGDPIAVTLDQLERIDPSLRKRLDVLGDAGVSLSTAVNVHHLVIDSLATIEQLVPCVARARAILQLPTSSLAALPALKS